MFNKFNKKSNLLCGKNSGDTQVTPAMLRAHTQGNKYLDTATEYLEWYTKELEQGKFAPDITQQTMDIAFAHWGDKGVLFYQMQLLHRMIIDLDINSYKAAEAKIAAYVMLTEFTSQLIKANKENIAE